MGHSTHKARPELGLAEVRCEPACPAAVWSRGLTTRTSVRMGPLTMSSMKMSSSSGENWPLGLKM